MANLFTFTVVPANPGWFFVMSDRRYPVIAWAFEHEKDGSLSRPYPVGPWGIERTGMKLGIISPNGDEFAVAHGPENSRK